MQRAVEGRQSSTLVALTTLLDALAKKGETVDLSDLSRMVECDARLITRILSQSHRPGALPVSSLTQAVQVLGLDRLRTVVLAALMAQHADSTNHAQREIAVFSLSSALCAQLMAKRCGEDPEQAFLCGSLRNYGQLILSTFRPAEFDLACGEACYDGPAAFKHTFGLTPLELAEGLLAETPLPKSLLEAMTRPDSASARERTTNPMLNLALGAAAFTDLMFDARQQPADFRRQAKELLAHYIPEANVAASEFLDDFMTEHKSGFADYARNVEFADIAQRPLVSLGRRIVNHPLHRSPLVPGRVSPQLEASSAASQPGTLRPGVVGRIAAAMSASDVLLFSFDSVLGAFRLASGTGQWAVGLRGSRLFGAADKHLFGLCVTLRQTLAIHDTSATAISSHTPLWMRRNEAPSALFLMPFGDKLVTQVLLVGWQTPRKVVPPPIPVMLEHNRLSPAHLMN